MKMRFGERREGGTEGRREGRKEEGRKEGGREGGTEGKKATSIELVCRFLGRY